MTRTRTLGLAVATLIVAGATAPARAQTSDARIRELIKQAAEQVATGQTTAPAGGVMPQTRTPSAAGDNRPIVRLTLDDAVKLALDRNLDIAVQRLNPEINDIAIASIKAAYHPALT